MSSRSKKTPSSCLFKISDWENIICTNGKVNLYVVFWILGDSHFISHELSVLFSLWLGLLWSKTICSTKKVVRRDCLPLLLVLRNTWNLISIFYSFRLQSNTFSFFRIKLLQKYHTNIFYVNCLFLRDFLRGYFIANYVGNKKMVHL